MDKLNELRQKRTEIVKNMEKLTASEPWGDDQQAQFDNLKADAEKLDTRIKGMEEVEARKADLNTPVVKVPEPRIEVGDAPEDRKFESFGHFLQAVRRADARGGYRDPRLVEERAISGASESIPSDGGYLVQTEIASEIWRRTNEVGVLLPRCRRIPIGANANAFTMNVVDESTRVTGSRWGGLQVYRKPEAGTATAKKVKYGQISLKLKKLIGTAYSTDELEADASALGAVMMQAFSEEFAFVIDDEIFRGDGASEMLGFTAAPCFVQVSKETDQTADSIMFENLSKMYARFYGSNGVWLAPKDAFPALSTMSIAVGTGGTPTFLPPGGASQAPYGTIFGMPVLFIEHAPTVGDANDICLVDLSQYLVIEKGGLNAASSMHVKFVEDEMCYRWTIRNDGRPIWKSALTPYKGSNTRSPFVGLAERA